MVIGDFYFPYKLSLINVSAISIEFKAAPLRRLSETIQRFKVFLLVLSSLILDINVSSLPAASIGVLYPPSSLESLTSHPSALFRASLTFSKENGFLNWTFTDSAWEIKTGILTQVAVSSILSSKIF